MKGTARQSRGSGGRATRGSGGRVQAKRRPGAGNRHRANALERQADDLATRAARGERGLGLRVTKTPAAGYQSPSSLGSPLSASVRSEMERSFHADFSLVRIHTDAHAVAAAHEHEALAFTSGRHIFFSPGAFAPHTDEGRHLLAHELTHVLQQTGEAKADGRVRATPRHSSGDVQREDPTQTPADEEQHFNVMAALYRRHATQADVETTIEAVRGILNGRLSNNQDRASGSALATAVQTARQFETVSGEARGFVLDCLKDLGFHNEAFLFLDRDVRLETKTLIFRGAFIRFLENLTIPPAQTGEVTESTLSSFQLWISEAFRHSSLRTFWPRRIIAGYRRFLLRPHLPPPPFDTELQQAFDEQIRLMNESPVTRGFMPQERVTLAWRLLRDFEAHRVSDCNAIQGEFFRGTSLPTMAARDVLREVRSREQSIAENATEAPVRRRLAEELIALCDEIGPIVEAALTQAIELIRAIGSMRSEALLGDDPIQFPVPRVEHAAVTPVHDALLASAQALFPFAADTQLPDATTYAQLVAGLRSGLEQATTVRGRRGPSAMERLDDAIRQEWTRGPQGRQRAQSLYVFAAVLDQVLALANQYDVTADNATPDFADERGAHRIRLARALGQFSRWMQWDDILRLCSNVLETSALRTRLWITGEWEPDEELPPERLLVDFPETADRPVLRDAPVTVRHLARWFRLDYNTRLRAVLLDILVHEDRLSADTRLGTNRLNQLFESADDIRRLMPGSAQAEMTARASGRAPTILTLQAPHRFFVRDFVAVVPDESTESWANVIAIQDKTRVTFGIRDPSEPQASNQPEAPGHIFPDTPSAGVFGWILPPLRPLYQVMRGMIALENIAVRRLMTEQGLTETAARAQLAAITDPAQWASLIAAENITDVDFGDLSTRLNDLLRRRNQPIEEQLPDLWRRVTILRRRQIALQQHDALQPYLDNRTIRGPMGESPQEGNIRRTAPERTIRAIEDFERVVQPPDEVNVQVPLLVLMLAAEIDGILTGGRMDPDFARGFYPLIARAIEAGEDPDRVAEMRRGTNAQDPAGNIVYIDRNLATALGHLRNARDAVDRAYQEAQVGVGYTTQEESSSPNGLVIVPLEGSHTPIFPSPQPNVDHEWVRGARIGPDGHPDLEHTGVRFRLLSIDHAFRFHPELGSQNPGPGAPAAYVDLRTPVPADSGTAADRLFVISVLNQETGHTNTVEVTADNIPLLEEFYEIFLWRSFQKQMTNLAAMSQSAMEWMIAGVGTILPPVAAAEVIARFTQMIASGELEDLVRMLRDDPQELFTRIYEQLRNELFRPERIWRYLLLGGQHPFVTLRTLRPRARPRRDVSPRSKFARIVHTFNTIGMRIADAVERLRLRVRGPLRSAQSNIAARPTLAWMLSNAVQWVEILPDLVRPEWLEGLEELEIPTEPAELVQVLRDRVDEIEGDARESIVRLLEGIRHFELPGQLLDLSAVTEIIIAFALDRFGARGRAIRLAMELIPVPQEHQGTFRGFKSLLRWVSDEIAAKWAASEVADPNVYWRDSIVPLIQDKFRETRDDLVTGTYRTINAFLQHVGVREIGPPTNLAETEVSAEPIDAEAAPSPREDDSLRPDAWRLPPGSGAPLDPVERRRYEQTFGASFRHVRVHKGPEGRAATDAVGADAVTSGSHIYLHPEAATAGTTSTRLLAHELTHVVQQTGITPPTQHPGPPRRGRDRGGLRVHREREEAAEKIGERVVNREALTDDERKNLEMRADGIQPSLSERTVNDIINELTTIRTSEQFTRDAAAGAPGGPVPGVEDARTIWNHVATDLTSATSGVYSALPSFLTQPVEVPQRIQAKFNASRDRVNGELQNIARLAQRPLPGPQRQGAVTTELDPGRFAQLLEGFLYGETGVALQITLHAATHLFERVVIINLSLARMNDETLWRIAVQRSFPANHAAIEAELRQRLFALRDVPGMESGLWSRTVPFKFSDDFIDDFTRFTNRRAAKPNLVPNLPIMSEYTNDASPRGDVLAVATHRQLTDASRSIGTHDRQSHHTTQFLLVEYFENRNPVKAFPARHQYPGNQFPGGAQSFGVMFTDAARSRVTSISAAGRTLNLQQLDDGRDRGGAMPAVLIAARTHQRGELHLLSESRWDPGAEDEDKGGTGQRRTQGVAIENAFTRNLPAVLRPRNDSEVERARFAQEVNRDPAGAARDFFNAAVATYHWMHGRMLPALERALRTEELAYYRGLAAIQHTTNRTTGELHTDYNLRVDDVNRIFRRAKANNNTVMSAAGWPTPPG